MDRTLIASELLKAAKEVTGGQGPLEKLAQTLFRGVKARLDYPIVGRTMTISSGVVFHIGGTFKEGGYVVTVGVNTKKNGHKSLSVWPLVSIEKDRKQVAYLELKKEAFTKNDGSRPGRDAVKILHNASKKFADLINDSIEVN